MRVGFRVSPITHSELLWCRRVKWFDDTDLSGSSLPSFGMAFREVRGI